MKSVIRMLLSLSVAAAPQVAAAGGFFAGDAGTQAMSRGGAFAARADDPTALQYNPAGLARLGGPQLYVGATFVNLSLSYDRPGTYPMQDVGMDPQPGYVGDEYPVVEQHVFQPVPFVAGAFGVGPVVVAVGVYAPSAAPERDFDETVSTPGSTAAEPAPAPQRYDTVKQKALVVLPSVAVAYSPVENLHVGGRFSWGFGSIEGVTYVWGVDNFAEKPGKDARFQLDVADWFVPAFGLGVLYEISPSFEIGANYESKVSVEAKGSSQNQLGQDLREPSPGLTTQVIPVPDEFAACEPGGTVAQLKACVSFAMPQKAQLGARWILRDAAGAEKADVELDLRWENWSAASDTNVVVDGQDEATGRFLEPSVIRHGFKDTFGIRLGGHVRVTPDLQVRAGAGFDTAAAPVSWTRVDLEGKEKITLTTGVAYDFSFGRIDAGFGYVHTPTRDVENVPLADTSSDNRVQPDPIQPLKPANAQTYAPYNAGIYKASYLLFGAGFTALF